MSKVEKLGYVTAGLLTTTIVSGFVVSRFAPRIGATITLTSYLAAGITAMAGVICVIKEEF